VLGALFVTVVLFALGQQKSTLPGLDSLIVAECHKTADSFVKCRPTQEQALLCRRCFLKSRVEVAVDKAVEGPLQVLLG